MNAMRHASDAAAITYPNLAHARASARAGRQAGRQMDQTNLGISFSRHVCVQSRNFGASLSQQMYAKKNELNSQKKER